MSVRSVITDIFGKSKSQQQTDALTALANQPVSISPYIFIVPLAALVVSGVIYVIIIRKK